MLFFAKLGLTSDPQFFLRHGLANGGFQLSDLCDRPWSRRCFQEQASILVPFHQLSHRRNRHSATKFETTTENSCRQ